MAVQAVGPVGGTCGQPAVLGVADLGVQRAMLVLVTRKDVRPLDNGALSVSGMVLLAFLGMLLLSSDDMPFAPLDPRYVGADGSLVGAAQLWGMNALLEHWAMAIHPPTLFVGYAGLTIPFAYAVAALVVDDDSVVWVNRATPYLMFSWLLLSVGIGLGAVWAYVVLGWGRLLGLGSVENASLLPWLVGVALIHSFTVYRKRGAFKRWSVMCACLVFAFVILGTFITRSGVVESVHAFGGDSVSLALFLVLIAASVLAGAVGLVVRRRSFGAQVASDETSTPSRLRTPRTTWAISSWWCSPCCSPTSPVSSALPRFCPSAARRCPREPTTPSRGPSASRTARSSRCARCSAGARPTAPRFAGVRWRRCVRRRVVRRAHGVFRAVSAAELRRRRRRRRFRCRGAARAGPRWYYNGLAVVGFAVASLLTFNAAFMVARAAVGRRRGVGVCPRSAAASPISPWVSS